MPVKLTHSTGFDGEEGSSKVRCNREGFWVEDLDATAWDLVCLLLAEVVTVSPTLRNTPGGASDIVLRVGDIRWSWCAREDVQLAIGNIV